MGFICHPKNVQNTECAAVYQFVYNRIIQNATVYVSVSVRRFPLSASILPLVPQPLPDITNIRLSPSIPYYHSPLENVLLLHFRQTTFFPRLNLSFEHVLYRYILINFVSISFG